MTARTTQPRPSQGPLGKRGRRCQERPGVVPVMGYHAPGHSAVQAACLTAMSCGAGEGGRPTPRAATTFGLVGKPVLAVLQGNAAADRRSLAAGLGKTQRPVDRGAGGNRRQSALPCGARRLPPTRQTTIGPTTVTALGGFDGDGRTNFGHLTWSAWDNNQALGSGAIWRDDCIPDCASGTYSAKAVSVRLSAPHAGHFTRLTEKYVEEGEGVTETLGLRRAYDGYWFYYEVSRTLQPEKGECKSLVSLERGFRHLEHQLVKLPGLSSNTLSAAITAEISLGSVGVCSNALNGPLRPALDIVPPGFALTALYTGLSGSTSTKVTYGFAPLGWNIPPGTGVRDLNPPVTVEWDQPHKAELGPSLSFSYSKHKLGVSVELLSIPIKKETVTLLTLGSPFLSASVGPELSFELSFDPKQLAQQKAIDESEGDTPDEADQQISQEIEIEVDEAIQEEVVFIDPLAEGDAKLLSDAGKVSNVVGEAADTSLAEDSGPLMDSFLRSVGVDAVDVGAADGAALDGAAG